MKLSSSVVSLSIGLILAVVGCVFFAVRWIDVSISYTYLEDSFNRHIGNANLVNSLLENELVGISEKDLLGKLEAEVMRRNKEVVVIDVDSDQGVIWLNEVRFELEYGRLKKIGNPKIGN